MRIYFWIQWIGVFDIVDTKIQYFIVEFVNAAQVFSAKNFKIYNIFRSDVCIENAVNIFRIESDRFAELISNSIDNAKNANAENFAYAVGDYLRIPKLYGAEGFDTEKLSNETMRNWTGYLYPESIVHLYYKAASISNGGDEAQIIPEVLRDTVSQYINTLDDKLKLEGLFDDEDVILIHLRIGDIGSVDNNILAILKKLKSRYSKFIIIAGIHSAWMHSSIAWAMDESSAKYLAYKNARLAFKELYESVGSFHWLVCDPDLAMCAASMAKRLFIHRGGFSAVLGLLAREKIYATYALEHFQKWEKRNWSTWEESLFLSSSLEILS